MIFHLNKDLAVPDPRSLVADLEQTFPRRTASRRAVLQAVVSWPGLFSAEELSRSLPNVGRATVYRTVASLLDAEVLCRVMMESGAPRYELGGRRHHHHLVCIECGRVQDVAGRRVDDFMGALASRYDYDMVGHRLEIYGRCAACQDEGRGEG